MKISQLLARHSFLVQQVHLASLAKAYTTLRDIANRAQLAGLTGRNALRRPDAIQGIPWATLTALDYPQSMIEEHFLDDDINALADAIAYFHGVAELDLRFRFSSLTADFVLPLEQELRQAGVVLDQEPTPLSLADSASAESPPTLQQKSNDEAPGHSP